MGRVDSLSLRLQDRIYTPKLLPVPIMLYPVLFYIIIYMIYRYNKGPAYQYARLGLSVEHIFDKIMSANCNLSNGCIVPNRTSGQSFQTLEWRFWRVW